MAKINDLQFEVIETFQNEDGSRVASRWRIAGKNNGILGPQADQQPISFTGAAVWAVREDGKLCHNWVERSAFELFQQLHNQRSAVGGQESASVSINLSVQSGLLLFNPRSDLFECSLRNVCADGFDREALAMQADRDLLSVISENRMLWRRLFVPGEGLRGGIHLIIVLSIRKCCQLLKKGCEPWCFLRQIHETIFNGGGLRVQPHNFVALGRVTGDGVHTLDLELLNELRSGCAVLDQHDRGAIRLPLLAHRTFEFRIVQTLTQSVE
jgi:hypothetical protein